VHTDAVLGFICIGCPCAWRPADVDELGPGPMSTNSDHRPMFSDRDAE
jgi:hypothetical protein